MQRHFGAYYPAGDAPPCILVLRCCNSNRLPRGVVRTRSPEKGGAGTRKKYPIKDAPKNLFFLSETVKLSFCMINTKISIVVIHIAGTTLFLGFSLGGGKTFVL